MAKRPVEAKKRRRVAKALRRRPLPAYIDLVQWLLDHRHARTRREAREIILAKRVKVDSHIIGVGKAMMPADSAMIDLLRGRNPRMEEQEVVEPLVAAKLRPDITVTT